MSFKDVPVSLRYFSEKLKIPFVYQVIRNGDIDVMKGQVRIMNITKFLTALV